jgi:NAD(P)-dependent dehydrogenase (short-subunit alcohol dehydrogenase family)
MSSTVLITGSSRGIGLEFVRQYAARGWRVFAAARNPAAAPLAALIQQYLHNITPVALDVDALDSVVAAAQTVAQHTTSLDVVINNAAINPDDTDSFSAVTPAALMDTYRTNCVGPILIAQQFQALLRRGQTPKLVNISSDMGSLTHKTYGGAYSYTMSKAALNMATRGLAVDLRPVIVIALDPGWVQTDMGSPNATYTAAQSVRGCLNVIDSLTTRDSGTYRNHLGKTHPW